MAGIAGAIPMGLDAIKSVQNIGLPFQAAAVIRLINKPSRSITFSCTFHETTVDAGQHEDVDWAYAIFGVFGTTKDVTINFKTKKGNYSKLVLEGHILQVEEDGSVKVYKAVESK